MNLASLAVGIKPTQDNVIIALEPKPTETASGLAIAYVDKTVRGEKIVKAREHRTAVVLASGPGYYRPVTAELGGRSYTEPSGVLVPNETRPGMRVIVEAVAGQDYSLDLNIPRHNLPTEFQELLGERGEFRIVREQEILAIIEEPAADAAE